MKIKTITNEFFKNNFDRKNNTEELNNKHRIDILCLENAIERFLSSGSKDDAFDVYFCFCEIFKVFGEGYKDNTRKLLNILADHELKAGGINDKHRDHYSHSVYVFALGISIYQLNKNFKDSFLKHLLLNDIMSLDEEFIYRWGLMSLFHDIGYPFEIAFNNIKSYTNETFGKIEPLLTYVKIDEFIEFSQEKKNFFSRALQLEKDSEYILNVHSLLSYQISKMTKIDYRDVLNEMNLIMKKSDKFMDHGYFSAIIILRKFFENESHNANELEIFLEVCACILMHSSFWRYKIGKDKKINLEQPLAYLLMLCDEIHIFDRIGFGRKSKNEPLPKACYLEQDNDLLHVTYVFDDKAIEYSDYEYDLDGSLLKSGVYEKGKYIESKRNQINKVIHELFDLSIFGKIKIVTEICNVYKHPAYHLSASFFQNILNIAMQIHKNYSSSTTYNKLEEAWDALSLEYKLSNILQAKSYAKKLSVLGYFYDDKEILLEKVHNLDEEQIEILSRIEHERWCNEKKEMGWNYASYDGNDENIRKQMRNMRKHNCLLDYDELSYNDQKKDMETVRFMLENLQKAGFTVYKADRRKVEEKLYVLGISGHLDLSKVNRETIAEELRKRFNHHLSKKNQKVAVLCACAQGFDLLAAEVAMELDLFIKIILPSDDEPYIKVIRENDKEKIFDKLMNYKNKEILHIPHLEDNHFVDLSKYISGNLHTLIAGWDQKVIDGPGGTYYTIELAKKYGKCLETIDIPR